MLYVTNGFICETPDTIKLKKVFNVSVALPGTSTCPPSLESLSFAVTTVSQATLRTVINDPAVSET